MTPVPKLLLVEDDTALREALTSSLSAHGYTVHAIADGASFDSAMAEHAPDLAILDVARGEGPDGFELARRIRSSGDTPVVFLTAADAVADRIRGFDAGGDDYLVKPFSVDELVMRIRAILRRAGRLPRPTIRVGDLLINVDQRRAERAGEALTLTPTEFDLLVALARRPGKSWPKRQLLADVWGFTDYQAHLVEVHISALRRKLEARGPRLIHTERHGGYSLRG